MNSSRIIDRASSIYPPTISPPDSPQLSDVNYSNPDISPISTHAPAPAWLRPSGIPQPKRSPGASPPPSSPAILSVPESASRTVPASSPTPEPASVSLPAPVTAPVPVPAPASEYEPEPTSVPIPVALAAAAPAPGWRDKMRAMGRSPSPAGRDAPPIRPQEAGPTRWDTYSGEKTEDELNGQTAAASPTQHPYKGTDPGFGYTAHITGGQQNGKPSHFLHVKLRKASDRKEVSRPQQEPWRQASGILGPSGRTAIVDPILDKPLPPDKRSFPTPAERRARGFFQKQGASGRQSPGPSAGLGIRSGTPTGGRETSQPEEKHAALRVVTGALDSMREAAAKAMPQKERPPTAIPAGEVVVSETKVFKYRLGGSTSRSESPSTPSADYGPPLATTRPTFHIPRKPSQDMLRGAYPEHAGPRAATMPIGGQMNGNHTLHGTGNNYNIPPRKDSRMNPASGNSMSAVDNFDFDPNRITSAFHSMGFSNEPKSHFSATTYNTSVGTDSPPATPQIVQPGVDAVPPLPTSSPAGDSILNRKRPVPSASNLHRTKPTRKPTPMQNSGSGSGDEAMPSEPIKPADRVTQLEEKLASLNKRKASLAAVIHELANVVQPSSIAYDMASRAEIKKTVEGLRIEQDAVLAEIQEVGLKLHRAYRRKDEELGGGGTGLWVRRVTE